MPRDVERATLYRGPINLWVEDETTRAYLRELWGDPAVVFFIGGGYEGVKAVVKDAERSGFLNVFGLIDRDFRVANKAGWTDPKKSRTFVLPKHEIENYLLDANILANSRYNNLQRSADQISSYMKEHARRMCWWAACCEVVAEFRARFRSGFLEDPKYPPVVDEESARIHVCDSDWFKNLVVEIDRSSVADVHQLLSEAHTRASARLSDGSWRDEFAGKQILRDVGSRIFDRQKAPRAVPKGSEFDADLAKEIGARQATQKAVPQDLADLLAALKDRIAADSTS